MNMQSDGKYADANLYKNGLATQLPYSQMRAKNTKRIREFPLAHCDSDGVVNINATEENFKYVLT